MEENKRFCDLWFMICGFLDDVWFEGRESFMMYGEEQQPQQRKNKQERKIRVLVL